MGYDNMERAFPCLCGKGQMLAEWKEHDTWPSSNRYIKWHFECADCAAEYEFTDFIDAQVVRKTDAQKLDGASDQRHGARLASPAPKRRSCAGGSSHTSRPKDRLTPERTLPCLRGRSAHCISSHLGCSEVGLHQDLSQLFFRKVSDGGVRASPLGDRKNFLTLKHADRSFRLNILEEGVQGCQPLIAGAGRRLFFSPSNPERLP